MNTTYKFYQWNGNKLLKQQSIPFPYNDFGEIVIPGTLPECNHISIRRTIKTNHSVKCAVIESLYI